MPFAERANLWPYITIIFATLFAVWVGTIILLRRKDRNRKANDDT
ncbi:hypothetical protein JD81_04627 [Micromonospora sagamiensis]|uniref:Uncharacterized protein n=1 Tax=Micromonospora sagamiensis TaxID=47875 RepID=A0A562WLK1_9ACTN|nr:hypothetical protein JD81_04627 [Micromonospora sagamiensis]